MHIRQFVRRRRRRNCCVWNDDDIVVDNFNFAPATATVPAGSTITWTNRDDVPHNVVSTERKFASPVLDTNEQFSHTFDAAGTYDYYCSIHPKMTGRVVVA